MLLSRVAFLSGIVSRHGTKFPLDIPLDQTSFPLASNKRDQPTPFGHKSAIAGHGEWTGTKREFFLPRESSRGSILTTHFYLMSR